MPRILGTLWIALPLFLASSGCDLSQQAASEAEPSKLRNLADLAIENLAVRLNVPLSEIVLIKETAVTWRNGSLGCPKEGMMYTQALVEGTLIVLRVDGKNYQYHSGQGSPPFYCEHPEKPAAKPSLD